MSTAPRIGLSALLLTVFVLCPRTFAIPGAQDALSPEGLAGWSLSQLEADAATRRSQLETLSSELDALSAELSAAEKGDRDAVQKRFESARAALNAAADELFIVIGAIEDKGGDMTDLRTRLLAIQGVRADNLNVGAMAALMTAWVKQGNDWIVKNGPELIIKLIAFIVILLLFKFLTRLIGNLVDKATQRSQFDVSELLRSFVVGLVRKLVFFLGLLFAFSAIGFDLTPILTGVGVMGFVIGFALQDTLGNFAAGIMILLYRPFDVGDWVEAGGVTGKVTALSLVATTMATADNQVMLVPNGSIWGGTIRNANTNSTRRVDLSLGVSYDDDLDQVHAMIEKVVSAHPLVLEEPAIQIEVTNLGESSVDFVIRPWAKTSDRWRVQCDLTKQLKQACDAEGISIPYPHREIHMHDSAQHAAA